MHPVLHASASDELDLTVREGVLAALSMSTHCGCQEADVHLDSDFVESHPLHMAYDGFAHLAEQHHASRFCSDCDHGSDCDSHEHGEASHSQMQTCNRASGECLTERLAERQSDWPCQGRRDRAINHKGID